MTKAKEARVWRRLRWFWWIVGLLLVWYFVYELVVVKICAPEGACAP